MKILKQSTTATVTVGPVLDANGAAVTTAVVGDFRISKNGTPATLSGATVTHDANGYYTIALTTSNTDTVGRLEIYSGNTAQATAVHNWLVLLASVFDAIQTNATNSTGGLVTATGSVTALAGAISTLTAAGVRTELATELARIDAAISSRMATYTQPTGFLAATFPATVSSFAGGAVASVTGSVGSISGVTFPTHFQNLEITANGHVSAVVQSIANNSITASSIQGGAITAAKFATDAITASALAADAVQEIQSGLALAADLLIVSDRVSYSLTILAGACSDAQTAAETYTLTIGGNTFTVDYTGLDSSGNRSTTTLSKA
jgi:hypothetical protein